MNPLISAFEMGIQRSEIPPSKVCVVSDIPFEPDVAKGLGVDFFHTIRGRTVAFGTGMKLANPALKVVPFVGDLMTLGGNHVVHAGRRNMELTVLCVNNFIYRKIAGSDAPAVASTFSPYSLFEEPFNVPHLANSCGALYTARWTALHVEEIADSVAEALNKKGFSMIEILAPGPNFYTDINDIESDLLQFYFDNSEVKNGEEPKNVGIVPDAKIAVGRFTDKERPTFIDIYNMQLPKILGDEFTPYGV